MAQKDLSSGLEPNTKLLEKPKNKEMLPDEDDFDTGRGLAKSLTLMKGVSMIVGFVFELKSIYLEFSGALLAQAFSFHPQEFKEVNIFLQK